jgi:MGT family glycosyltransferase
MSWADANTVPWAVFSPFTPFLRSPGMPPVGPGMRPLCGRAGAIRDSGVRAVVDRVMDRPVLPRLNAMRSAVGAPSAASIDQFVRRAPLMLVVGGEPFEYPRPDWGERVALIGACVSDPEPQSIPSWLADIDRPVVLVTTSSIRQADSRLGATALEALADLPVHTVVTFPAGIPEGLTVPPNATVRRFVAHGPLLDRAVCAVTHGGMGATVRALARGVPVCVVPFGRDQPEVAMRVEVAGCGTRLPARRLTPGRLRAAVQQAMTMTEGARRVAAGFAGTGGVARGADLIEQRLLSRYRSRGASV